MPPRPKTPTDRKIPVYLFLGLSVVITYYSFDSMGFNFDKNPTLYFAVLFVALVPCTIFSLLIYGEGDEFSPREAPARFKFFFAEVLPNLLESGIRALAFWVGIVVLILMGLWILLGVFGLLKFGIEQL